MSRVAATRAVLFAGAAVLGTLGVVVAFGTGSEPVQSVPVIPPTQAPRGVPVEQFGNGTLRLFTDIKPGTYRTGGSSTPDWPMCTWKIHKGDRIVSSGTATGPTTITVEPVHDAVESKNCLVWRRVGDVP